MNTKDAPDELLKAMWKAVIPKMEVLRPGWQEFLKKNLQSLYGSAESSGVFPDSVYSQNRADFEKAYPDWNIQEEQLLVYWIYTYFCGAVYDGEIFAKVKMAVVCTLLIHELDMGAYLKWTGVLSGRPDRYLLPFLQRAGAFRSEPECV